MSRLRRQVQNHGPAPRSDSRGTRIQYLLHDLLREKIQIFLDVPLPSGQVRVLRQFRALRHRVLLVMVRVFGLFHPGNRIERKTQPHRRVAGNQIHPLGAKEPRAAFPLARPVGIVFAAQRQGVAHDFIQPLFEHLRQPRSVLRVIQIIFEWIDVDRKPPFLPQVIPGVLIAGLNVRRIHAQSLGQLQNEYARFVARAASPERFSSAISFTSRQIGWPSLRQ